MEYQAHETVQLMSGTRIPRCIYGTAEKTDPELILEALRSGFRGLDSACQPKYYHEEVVGRALECALSPEEEGGLGLSRNHIYIQTKFTTPAGNVGGNAPYLPDDSIPEKVSKSLQMSLSKLKLAWVDTLLLHGPMPTVRETIEVWKAMETFVPEYVRNLGLSNVNLEQIRAVCAEASIWPATIQNPFGPQTRFDFDVRTFCNDHGMVYQAFSVLRANPVLLTSRLLGWLANKTGLTEEEALLDLVLSMSAGHSNGLCVLNGTTNAARMRGDLAAIERLGKVPSFIMNGFQEALESQVGVGQASERLSASEFAKA